MKVSLVPLLALLVKLAPVLGTALRLSESVADYGLISKSLMGEVYDQVTSLDKAIEAINDNGNGLYEECLSHETIIYQEFKEFLKNRQNWAKLQTAAYEYRDILQQFRENLHDNMGFVMSQNHKAFDEDAPENMSLPYQLERLNAKIFYLREFDAFLQTVEESDKTNNVSADLLERVEDYYEQSSLIRMESGNLITRAEAVRSHLASLKRPLTWELYEELEVTTRNISNSVEKLMQVKTGLCQAIVREKFNIHYPAAFGMLMLQDVNDYLEKVNDSLNLLAADHITLLGNIEEHERAESVDVEPLQQLMQSLLYKYSQTTEAHNEILTSAFKDPDADPQSDEDLVPPVVGVKRKRDRSPGDEPPPKH